MGRMPGRLRRLNRSIVLRRRSGVRLRRLRLRRNIGNRARALLALRTVSGRRRNRRQGSGFLVVMADDSRSRIGGDNFDIDHRCLDAVSLPGPGKVIMMGNNSASPMA